MGDFPHVVIFFGIKLAVRIGNAPEVLGQSDSLLQRVIALDGRDGPIVGRKSPRFLASFGQQFLARRFVNAEERYQRVSRHGVLLRCFVQVDAFRLVQQRRDGELQVVSLAVRQVCARRFGEEFLQSFEHAMLVGARSIKVPSERQSAPVQSERHFTGSRRMPLPSDSLEHLRSRIDAFATEREWDQFHNPKNLAMAIAGEVGELIEHFQWLTFEQAANLDADTREAVALEAADVLLFLIRLCDKSGIDLAAAAERKIELNAEKYPVDKARGRSTKYDKL
jgi:dCTP diphosphatase